MNVETDPAYFEPEDWNKVEAENAIDECYRHETTGTEISPEKFHQLYYDAKVVKNADVTPNDELRELADFYDWKGEGQLRKSRNDDWNFYDGLCIGRKRSSTELYSLVDN